MNKKVILAAASCAVLFSLTLAGCSKEVEEPTVPPDTVGNTTASGYEIAEASKLKKLAIGESAVWKEYEVKVASIDRAEGKLSVQIDVTAHSSAQSLSTECLMSFGMPPISSTFSNNTIKVSSNQTASGTLVFDDQYNSQRLFWNDGATEATWLLDLPPVQTGEAAATPNAENKQPEKTETPAPAAATDEKAAAQKQAVAALEAEMTSLFDNNTLYKFASVDTTKAKVTPVEGGGYEYINSVSVTDGGAPRTVDVKLRCEANGNCISMTVDGAMLF